MAINKTMLVYVAFDIVFLACAGMLIGASVASNISVHSTPNIATVAQTLLLDECPLKGMFCLEICDVGTDKELAALVNGIIMVIAFLISIPGMFMKENRKLLTIHGWLVVLSAVMTLGVGLAIWFETLRTKKNLSPLWTAQNSQVISLLQHNFQCCGYADVTKFVVDDVCPNAADAARHGLCQVPFSAYANSFLDVVFTAMFGVCAVDAFLVLSVMCVLKERLEQARYKRIDEKHGYGRG